jgi:hypothetical protein
MTEAYELLGAEIGEDLSLGGVHGTQLQKIAEKLKAAKDAAEAGITALKALGGAKALDLTPESILILTDPSGDVDELTLRRLKDAFKVKGLLMLPDDATLDLVGEEALQQLCLNLVKTFPQLYPAIVKQVLET